MMQLYLLLSIALCTDFHYVSTPSDFGEFKEPNIRDEIETIDSFDTTHLDSLTAASSYSDFQASFASSQPAYVQFAPENIDIDHGDASTVDSLSESTVSNGFNAEFSPIGLLFMGYIPIPIQPLYSVSTKWPEIIEHKVEMNILRTKRGRRYANFHIFRHKLRDRKNFFAGRSKEDIARISETLLVTNQNKNQKVVPRVQKFGFWSQPSPGRSFPNSMIGLWYGKNTAGHNRDRDYWYYINENLLMWVVKFPKKMRANWELRRTRVNLRMIGSTIWKDDGAIYVRSDEEELVWKKTIKRKNHGKSKDEEIVWVRLPLEAEICFHEHCTRKF